MKSAILFLVFNRPSTTEQVFEAIRRAQPTRLYVAADGARENRPDEASSCALTREIATKVDWPCQVATLFRDTNLGCRKAVTDALDWFFAHESEGIILEDDCLPDPSFFTYADELLAHYRDDPRVMALCGGNYGHIGHANRAASYTFARPFDPWGWASWRRAWHHYDRDLDGLGQLGAARILRNAGPRMLRPKSYWNPILAATRDGLIDTWDYQWTFSIFQQGGLVAFPRTNLVSNIGFGSGASHTLDHNELLADAPTRPLDFPLRHPARLKPDKHYEWQLYRTRFDYTLDIARTRWREEVERAIARKTPNIFKAPIRKVMGRSAKVAP